MAQPSDRQETAEAVRTTEAPRSGFARAFEALRYRDFRFLFVAQLTNSASQWMQMIALPILVLNVTNNSGINLGVVMFARTLPAIALSPFSGVFADTFDRRTLLLSTRVASTALAAWFAIVNITGSVNLVDIYVFAILRGITMSFDQAPRRALIPGMVPREAVVNALALNAGGQQMMRVLAASMAGVVIALWGVPIAFASMAGLYVIGIPLLLGMHVTAQERTGYQGFSKIFTGAKDGLGYSLSTPVIRSALLVAVCFFVFGMSFSNVFAPLLAKKDLGLGDGGLGWLMAVMGVGGSLGTLVVAYLSPSHHRGIILTIALSVYGALLVAMAGSSYLATSLVAFMVIFFVGAGQSVFMPLISTIVLQAAPDNMRGRAISTVSQGRSLTSGGAAIAGFAAGIFGEQEALIGFGVACIAGGIALASIGALRRVD